MKQCNIVRYSKLTMLQKCYKIKSLLNRREEIERSYFIMEEKKKKMENQNKLVMEMEVYTKAKHWAV